MKKWINRAISVFEYLVAGYMVLAGGITSVAGVDESVTGFMHALYGTKIGVFIVGVVIVISGIVLIYGKVKKKKRVHGRGLFYCYLCFFFAAILNAVAYAGDPTVWVSNVVMAAILAAIWLRWRFKTEYLDANYFRRSTEYLRDDLPPAS